jgi:hypothetical protein
MLDRFLGTEASNQDIAEAMLSFINSYHIRSGEFEGNEFVILKLDYVNFIIYYEMVDKEGNRGVNKSLAIYRHDLQKAIFNCSKKIWI